MTRAAIVLTVLLLAAAAGLYLSDRDQGEAGRPGLGELQDVPIGTDREDIEREFGDGSRRTPPGLRRARRDCRYYRDPGARRFLRLCYEDDRLADRDLLAPR